MEILQESALWPVDWSTGYANLSCQSLMSTGRMALDESASLRASCYFHIKFVNQLILRSETTSVHTRWTNGRKSINIVSLAAEDIVFISVIPSGGEYSPSTRGITAIAMCNRVVGHTTLIIFLLIVVLTTKIGQVIETGRSATEWW